MAVRRVYSVPERLALLGYLGCAMAFVYPIIRDATGLVVPCPLRTMTGIPCPVCGLTTGAMALSSGDVPAAFAANPGVPAMAAIAIGMIPVLALRAVGAIGPPAPASATTRRVIGWAMVVVAVVAWVFQLRRFELI